MQPSIIEDIKASQVDDGKLEKLSQNVAQGRSPIHEDGTLRFQNKLCVPNKEELKKNTIEEAHDTRHLVPPGGIKMYKDLRQFF